MQHTLAKSVTIKGIGLHSGTEVTMNVKPAPVNHGISFVRTDMKNSQIPAKWDRVVDTRLCTVIGNKEGATIGTVEHIMAALRGCHIDNAIIELNGQEVPIMDGSSSYFVNAFDEVGIKSQMAARRAIKLLKNIEIVEDDKKVSLTIGKRPAFEGEIDFSHPEIGNQTYKIEMVNGAFRHNLAKARTFGFIEEVNALRNMGLALGGSLDNAIVLEKDKIMNEDGLRFDDEFIRHKLLDAIGDLYLAGAPIIGTYHGVKAGHAMNNKLLHTMFKDDNAWCWVEINENGEAVTIDDNKSNNDIAAI